MSRYYFLSFLDALDGADPASAFAGKKLGADASFLDFVEADYPTAYVFEFSEKEILTALASALIDIGIYADLSLFQDHASFLDEEGDLGTTFFPYEITVEGLINSVDPLALVPEQFSYAADIVTGTPGADVFDALAGDDEVYGKAGKDILSGSEGNDLLVGGGGADKLKGGVGDDTLIGGRGNDILNGGEGQDLADYSSHGAVTVDLAVTGPPVDRGRQGQACRYREPYRRSQKQPPFWQRRCERDHRRQ